MRKHYLILFVVILFALVSCQMLQVQDQKAWGDMTGMERLTIILHAYNTQYEDYKAMAALPDLTETQKDILRARKKILTEVYPMIGVYASVVVSGGEVSPSLELEIMRLLNSLGAKIGG